MKDRVMSDVASVVEIILRITRDASLEGPIKENIPISRLKLYTPPAQIKQTLCTKPGVTYAQITKLNSYAPTNIEEEPHTNQSHQQINDMPELKNDEKPF
jgi:hypothetical protein